jgi:hypothetical protein
MHKTLSAGPQARFEEGAQGQGLRPLASDSNVRATELPNALLGKERSQLRGNIELPSSQSSHLELQVGTSMYASIERPFLSGQNPEPCLD